MSLNAKIAHSIHAKVQTGSAMTDNNARPADYPTEKQVTKFLNSKKEDWSQNADAQRRTLMKTIFKIEK